MVDEVGLETIEKTPSPEEEIDRVLTLAASYLATKMASAWKPESPADRLMRLSGAEIQQRLTAFVLENYDSSHPRREKETRRWLKERLRDFWQGYHHLVLRPLEARGYNIEGVNPNTGMELVLSLKQGVKGMIATALMARDSGWEVEFPKVEEDVRFGRDLIVKKEGKEVALQVKCRKGAKFVVKKKSHYPLVRVTIPADKWFFLDSELGIPHRSRAEDFGRWLNKQLRGGR